MIHPRPQPRLRLRSDRRLALLAAVLVGVAGFQLVIGLGVTSAAAPYWRFPYADLGQMLAGELAGLRAPWSWPLLVTDTLTAPDRVSLVYTDSLPWLTALLKLLHLGGAVNGLGLFLLGAWIAQAAGMWALLRALGVERGSTLFAGALLALLFPAWLARQLGHVALSGHAFELFALALAVACARQGATARRLAAFVALGVVAVGVHAYHVPPVTLLFLASLASEALQRRRDAGRRTVLALAAYVGAIGLGAWAAGYFVGRGESGGAAALGVFGMNLAGPVWPQASTLAQQRWDGRWFTGMLDPTGGQAYEGFNYLGAGVLLLLSSAAWLWSRRARGEGSLRPRVRRWGPLGGALALLALWAVGPAGYLFKLRLWSLPLPDAPWLEPLALFRCDGRFFWSVGYFALAAALASLDRLAGARTRAALLAGAVVLQAVDMSGLVAALHERWSRGEAPAVPLRLDTAAFEGRGYRIFPAFFCSDSVQDGVVVRQLALVAQRRHGFTTSAQTARGSSRVCGRPIPDDALRDAEAGDRRITVILSGGQGGRALLARFSGRTDCGVYGAAHFCGRDLDGLGLAKAAPTGMTVGTHLDLRLALSDPGFRAALVQGWSKPEPTGVWSQGGRAVLRLPRPDLPPGAPMVVRLEALGFRTPGRPVPRARVSVAGKPVAELHLLDGGYTGYEVLVPARLAPAGRPLELAFDLPDAASPGPYDRRRLSLGLRQVSISH